MSCLEFTSCSSRATVCAAVESAHLSKLERVRFNAGEASAVSGDESLVSPQVRVRAQSQGHHRVAPCFGSARCSVAKRVFEQRHLLNWSSAQSQRGRQVRCLEWSRSSRLPRARDSVPLDRSDRQSVDFVFTRNSRVFSPTNKKGPHGFDSTRSRCVGCNSIGRQGRARPLARSSHPLRRVSQD